MSSEMTVPADRFLLITVGTADAPPATRVRVRRQIARLLTSVRTDGGTARRLTVEVTDPAEYAQLVAQFNAERDTEYGEVVE
ncbi:hypothetical protein ACFVHW_06310 [Streptomyces sp. NPDC127110]|uniref:hypothetical protein n=1 Tax=Streptomyces sp. NPDC127110 TaxID=3345362 RepID=UPI003638A5DB